MTDTLISPAPTLRAPGFWRGTWVIASLELQQRRRSRTLWILAAVWFVIIGIVTGLTWFVLQSSSSAYDQSFDAYPLFSLIVYFVLLFGTLVAPAISAGSVSSERIGGTLATTQVTLISTWSILIGKAVAAWLTGLAFLVVAAPFVILSVALAQASPRQLLVALLALVLQIGLFTIMGVGLSAMISSPLFAIVTAYLTVAALSIGTLIGFGLAMGTSTEYVEVKYQTATEEYWEATSKCYDGIDYDSEADQLAAQQCESLVPQECTTATMTTSVLHADRYWWILALNPYVVVGDMVSVRTEQGYPEDIFGMISYGVRSLQLPENNATPDLDECGNNGQHLEAETTSVTDKLAGTIPVWWIGLGLQILLAGGALWGGYRRLHTPAKKLPKGSRIA